jgi:hypothetical protein
MQVIENNLLKYWSFFNLKTTYTKSNDNDIIDLFLITISNFSKGESVLTFKNIKLIHQCINFIKKQETSINIFDESERENVKKRYSVINSQLLNDRKTKNFLNEKLINLLKNVFKIFKFRLFWKSDFFFTKNVLAKNFRTKSKKTLSNKILKTKLDIKKILFMTQSAHFCIMDSFVSFTWFAYTSSPVKIFPWWRVLNTREAELEFFEQIMVLVSCTKLNKLQCLNL